MFSGRTNIGSARETTHEESINHKNSTSVTRSDDGSLVEPNRLEERNATLECGQMLLKSRIRELEYKNHYYIIRTR
jgi:hypothetical protein